MPGITAQLDAAEVAAAFGDLPTLAPVAVEVLRLADDDLASLEDIADVVGRDPGLAAQMLRVANSAVFGMGGTTTSLARAMSILGLRTVKLLSLSFSVVAQPDLSDPTAVLIWRHTLATSALSRVLATSRDPRVGDEAFIAALLGDLGRLALVEHGAYLDAAHAGHGWLDREAELEVAGCTSDEVTARILEGWGLPAVLADAVRHRADPSQAYGTAARIAKVLAVADAAALLVVTGPDAAGLALEHYRTRALDLLDLTGDETDRLLVEAAPALEEIARMFRAELPHDLPLDALLLRAKESLARLSLDAVVALSQEQSRAQHLESENRRLAAEAATDALTALANRRAYDAFLDRTIATRLRRPGPGSVGLLMIDVDRFKAINDTHGHRVGDDVLRLMSARLALHTRRDEFVARIGGEEFAVVLPVTHADEIAPPAGPFPGATAADPLDTPIGPLVITASVGGSWTDELDADASRRLYAAADAALQEAKATGRNRARMHRA